MPDLRQGATVTEIREAYEAEKTKLVTRCFTIAQEAAQQTTVPLSPVTKKSLDGRSLANVAYAEAENYARGLRDSIKEEYLSLDAEMKVAINLRAQLIESELLMPEVLDPADLIAASQMSADAMSTAVEVALDAGEPAESALLLLFKVARENDMDGIVAKVMTHREDISDLMVELAEADAVPELDPDTAFETYAAEAPSGPEILGAQPRAVNVAGRL